MNVDKIAERSYQRVADRIPDDSPLKGDDGSVLCPWCRKPMAVRMTALGHIHRTSEDKIVPIDGVRMKCHTDDGCAYRPDFDVPITEEEYEKENEARNSQKHVDVASDREDTRDVEERLRALGYKA